MGALLLLLLLKLHSKPPTLLRSRSDGVAVAKINAEAAAFWRSRRVTQRHFPSIHRCRGLIRFSGRFVSFLCLIGESFD